MVVHGRKQARDITVAIATRDRPEMVQRCLENLLLQSVLPGEIVVVDQSQGKETAHVVEQFRAGPIAMIYEHQSAQGLGVGQNRALILARGQVVAVTDDDCVPDRDWVKAIDRAFKGRDAVDFMAGAVLPYGPERADTFPVATRTGTKRLDLDRRAMPWEIGSGNNFAVRRGWLEKVDGNDERLGPGSPGQGGVDMDLFYRLARAGARMRYDPEALVFHERVTRESRMARRGPYGYGMGACCAIWLRQGDYNALRVLAYWIAMRGRILFRGLLKADFTRVQEELLVLAGTIRGLVYGLRVKDQRARYDWSPN